MRNLLLALSLFFIFTPAIAAKQTEQSTPDARRTLEAWLVAFRSGERDQLAQFVEGYGWPHSLDDLIAFRNVTGGFDLLSIEKTSSTSIEFVVQETGRERRAAGRLALSGEPLRVTEAYFVVIPAGASFLGFDISQSMRETVIADINQTLHKYYVFNEIAKAMTERLVKQQKRGEYQSLYNGVTFAELVTTHLREVSNDLHLRLVFSPLSNLPPLTDELKGKEYRQNMEQINCGFEQAEILPDNIGLIKFDIFADPEICGATASATIKQVKDVNALIIDMRANQGGMPAMVAYVTSYFFEKPTHLNDIYNRAEDTTRQWWTLAQVPGDRLISQPIYLLTSKRTFSAAEEFAYNLQALGRAKIIGETTGGGAHPVCEEQINAQFTLIVPCERSINPITKTNWEGTGVKPDVEVPSEIALDKALALIAEVSSSN